MDNRRACYHLRAMSNKTTEPILPQISDAAPDDSARRALHEENRLSWNEATRAHNSHKRDQAMFFREGGNKLFPEETALLGDLHGKSVLHLQCNSGQDTLSIKQLGAASVTGVDISDEAIDFARKLAADSGLAATFHRADIYEWLAKAGQGSERWDVVFLFLRRDHLAIGPEDVGARDRLGAAPGRTLRNGGVPPLRLGVRRESCAQVSVFDARQADDLV